MNHIPRWFWLAAVLLVVLLWQDWSQRPVVQPAGLRVDLSPRQELMQVAQPVRRDEFSLLPRARFEVVARVLSRERYYWGASASLAPLDLALGWGPMSDQSIVDRIEVSQGARWYILRWGPEPPLEPSEIMQHSGNMHIIPADKGVRKQVLELRAGEFIQLNGYLVDVQGPGGFHWATSLSRDDTGDGSCELFLVESVGRLDNSVPLR